MAAKPYREGDWFMVPLRDGSYARGKLARASKSGVLLGYFFGPALSKLPLGAGFHGLRPEDAILVGHFGHLGLLRGKWPIVRTEDDWNPELWRCTDFSRTEELSGRTFIVEYADDDPGKLIQERIGTPDLASSLPKDRMMGAGYVEAALTRLLTIGET